MLRSTEEETEILLGNKQLLGIFFVVAILLGIAFTGGYMVGRGSGAKQPAPPTVTSSTAPAGTGGETHSVSPDSAGPSDLGSSSAPGTSQSEEPPLGSPQRKKAQTAAPQQPDVSASTSNEAFSPQSGQEFLQVAAVQRDEALAVADVLHKKGFQAHAVPKPGTNKIYRVLIGPIRDAGDLSSTRDALRRTGFREVIVQRY